MRQTSVQHKQDKGLLFHVGLPAEAEECPGWMQAAPGGLGHL